MADTLIVTGSNTTATLVGAWELRAGSHDTTEWLDGASDTTYPGGGPDTFKASNTSGANGYDAGPKMALITLGSTTNGATVTLSGGATSVLTAVATGGTSANAVTLGATILGLVVTLPTTGTVTSGQLIVFYN
tara:strand:+ start:12427 stop:12825 length:399 start_codon:yes stop_codon:yes gene_type:complete